MRRTIYGYHPATFIRKAIVVFSGMALGVYIVDRYYQPMQELYDGVEKGKLALLEKYNKLYEEAKGRRTEEEELRKTTKSERGR